MPNNFSIKGTGSPDFGTDNVGYTAIGTIISGSRKDTGDKLELKDRQGNVFIVIYFNAQNQCEIEVIFDTTVTLPVRGDALSICSLTNVLCDEVEKKWERGAECKLMIRATRYAHLVLT